MRLTELTDRYKGDTDPEIKGMTQDSRQVKKGWLFAALPGAKLDGRNYIADAITNGAVAILTTPGTDIPPTNENEKVAIIADENPRRALSQMAANFYNLQPEVIAAVTGTNGKTSTVFFAQQLWDMLGVKGASLGTLGVRGPGMVRSGSLTTPDPVSLHAELADMAAAGITHLAMEASSHGLHQSRLDGVKVTAAGFTNLSRDHLDYHKSMEEYLIAKAHLFTDILQKGGTAVLNADIPEYDELLDRTAERGYRVLSYGRNARNIILKSAEPTTHGQKIQLVIGDKEYETSIPLVGEFQVMNVLCALGLVMSEDARNSERTDKLVGVLDKIKGAPGRLQLVEGHPHGAVYVDYAHTPDALENVLKALRPHTDKRLICLVGCGGDRDNGKRPVMARIAAELSDLAIISDDNPRSEDPAQIRAQMIAGIDKGNFKEIGDRREAITFGINELKDGDIFVIAGKGHEQGQIIGGKTEPFDDTEEATKAITALERGKAS